MEGVVKLVPACNDDPPVELLYQLIVPLLALAPNATVPASHLDNGVVELIVGVEANKELLPLTIVKFVYLSQSSSTLLKIIIWLNLPSK